MNPGDLAVVSNTHSINNVGNAGTSLYKTSSDCRAAVSQIEKWLTAQTMVLVLSDHSCVGVWPMVDKHYVLVVTLSCDVGWVMESRLKRLT